LFFFANHGRGEGGLSGDNGANQHKTGLQGQLGGRPETTLERLRRGNRSQAKKRDRAKLRTTGEPKGAKAKVGKAKESKMSLTDQAVKAISSYREALLKSPRDIESEQDSLRRKLTEIGRSDSNIFYTVNKQSFIGFPDGERFDKEAYITFRYLFESSYVIRRALVSEKRKQLEALAGKLIAKNKEVSDRYDLEYNQLSLGSIGKRAALKAESQYNGISSSKIFYAIQQACSKPFTLGVEEDKDWIMPSEYKKRIHREFRNSCREIGKSWGLTESLIDFYITHIELKKKTEKLAIASAIAGGTVLAAWGLSKAFEVGHGLAAGSASATTAGSLSSSGGLGGIGVAPVYGFENLPQYVAIQGNPLAANQAAYFNHLSSLGGTNMYDVQIAMLNNSGNMLRSMTEASSSIIGRQYNYDCAPVVINSFGGGFNQASNMLGANTNLYVREIGDSLVTITGSIGGQNVNTNIRKIGNMLNITNI